ncbi:hypothetical protein KFK09_006344 [Dendrobium nobile]|uniref:adenine phosphoribosyltransferase n=1 Tax=Dendrobium nobile TaxID=94219 RepID=A0A8T3BT74_DENNO|nr:hypothetical protein KFK09_006344 [Dendrobium nobile]
MATSETLGRTRIPLDEQLDLDDAATDRRHLRLRPRMDEAKRERTNEMLTVVSLDDAGRMTRKMTGPAGPHGTGSGGEFRLSHRPIAPPKSRKLRKLGWLFLCHQTVIHLSEGTNGIHLGEVLSEAYELEYGKDCLEMNVGAVQPRERVLIFDDLIATGGTLCAAMKLIEKAGGEVVEFACLIGSPKFKGRYRLNGKPVYVLVECRR